MTRTSVVECGSPLPLSRLESLCDASASSIIPHFYFLAISDFWLRVADCDFDSRQLKRHHLVAHFRVEFPMAASTDHHILFFACPIGHGIGLRALREFGLPQLVAGLDIKRPQMIVDLPGDDYQN